MIGVRQVRMTHKKLSEKCSEIITKAWVVYCVVSAEYEKGTIDVYERIANRKQINRRFATKLQSAIMFQTTLAHTRLLLLKNQI